MTRGYNGGARRKAASGLCQALFFQVFTAPSCGPCPKGILYLVTVYREFKDIDTFMAELNDLLKNK